MKIKLFFIVIILSFYSCSNSLSQEEVLQYTNQGKEIAQATAKELGGNLVKKMKEGGVKEAVPFCNTMAIPLTDKMSEKYKATIKRTSLRLRNDKNSPNKEEVDVINKYNSLSTEGKPMKPIVELDKAGKPHFYAPIVLQKKCLACHGEIGNNITIKSDSIIKSYYPNDLATGFKEGDLRGIWSITFNANAE